MRRKLFITLLLILLIPVLAYGAFPWYARLVLNQLLRESGTSITALDISRPGWQSLAIAHISLRNPGAGCASIDNTLLEYGNRFTDIRVSIERIAVVLESGKEETPTESGLLVSDFLPGNYLDRIPTLEVFARTVEISRPGQSEKPQPIMKLTDTRLTKSADIAGLHGTLVGDNTFSVELTVTHDNHFHFKAVQPPEKQALAALDGQFTRTDRGVTLKSKSHVNIAQPFYFNTSLDETIGGFTGTFKSDVEFEFENKSVAALTDKPAMRANGIIEGDLENSTKGILLQSSFSFHLNLDDTNWTIKLDNLPSNQDPALLIKALYDDRQHAVTVALPESLSLAGTTTPPTSEPGKNISTGSRSNIAVNYGIDNLTVAQAEIGDFAWNGTLPVNKQFQASLNTNLRVDSETLLKIANVTQLQLQKSETLFSADIELSNDSARLRIKDQSGVTAEKISTESVSFNSAEIRFPSQVVSFRFADMSVSPLSFVLQSQNLTASNYLVEPIHMEGQASMDDAKVSFGFISGKTRLRQDGKKANTYRIPPYRLSGEFYLSEASESLPSRVMLTLLNQCDNEVLQANWQQNGELTITTAQQFSRQNSLGRWLNLRDLTADIPKGKLAASITWPSGDNASPRIAIDLDNANIEGSLGTFRNVQLALSTQAAESNPTYPLRASADSVNIGVEVENVVLQTDFTGTDAGLAAHIHQVSGNVLGGRAFIENQRWVAGRDSTIVVHLQNLDLGELVRTQNIESLTTTGSMNGVIPIKIEDDGNFSLVDGSLSDNNGGVIRYQSSLSESEGLNEELQLTLDVLENFKYDVLDTSVEYSDGNLVLRSKIFGSNPEVAGGQKIDLNLNTEVNLKSAFQAMRLQAGLETQVERLFSASGDSDIPFCQQPL